MLIKRPPARCDYVLPYGTRGGVRGVGTVLLAAAVFGASGCAWLEQGVLGKSRQTPAQETATAAVAERAPAPDASDTQDVADLTAPEFAGQRDGALDGLRRGPQMDDDALSLDAAWRLALLNDPRHQAALSQRAASEQERAVGRAALLPQIQASAYRGRVRGDRYLPDMTGALVGSELSYDSTSASISLQQPLLDYALYTEYRRGRAQAEEGAARYEVQRNETGLRVATAYYRALLAQGRLDLQDALVTSLEERVRALTARYEQDEGTRTEVAETKARLALAQADTVASRDALEVALRELDLLIGRPAGALAPLTKEFHYRPPHIGHWEDGGLLREGDGNGNAGVDPADTPQADDAGVVQWLDYARLNSPEIELARKAVALARVGVDQATAEFLPSAGLVASLAHADSEELSSLSQKSNTAVVGVQVNIPLFAGGYNSAGRAQAAAMRRVAESRYQATLEKVQADVIREYTRMDGGAQRVRALEAAEASTRFSLEATSKSFEYGIASNLDVLKVQDALHHARHELLTARLDYLIARVRLIAAAGRL